jgi:toxin ParE1/3/4
MHPARFRPAAWQDISETIEYLETQGGIDLAQRFLDAVMASMHALEKMPRMGAPCHFQRTELHDFRRWPVKDFERWLIFYRLEASHIDVVRVLHSALDMSEIFG